MRIPLLGGAYQSRSLVAGAQRSVNLYAEINEPDGSPPVPVTHYPTPGLRPVSHAPIVGRYRATYRATNGDLYAVVNSSVYYVSPDYTWTLLGSIAFGTNPVCCSDNGLCIVIVDGSAAGYAIDMVTRAFGTINDPSFYGGTSIDYLDTFFILNRPGTSQFYISLSLVTFSMLTVTGNAFDPLDIAGKTGSADNIQCLAAIHGELWLIGELTSEIWTNTGAADFTFARIHGAEINHGCIAPYSLSQQDVSLFWLTQDRQGSAIVAMSSGYAVERISTHAIEQEFQSYSKIDDAIGYCHQIEGHAFYILNFPTANKTWAYELSAKQWHERGSLDGNGTLNRHRGNAFAFAYNQGHVGDFQNGTLYVFDQDYFFDGDTAIPRIRTFPHIVGQDSNRIEYIRFVADMEVGQTDGTIPSNPPLISLRWSDTRGVTYGNPVLRSMGATGEYYVAPQWRKLGMARDRVFELSWSEPVRTALNGAWIEIRKADS